MARREQPFNPEDRLETAEADPFLLNLELVNKPGFFSVSAHAKGRSISIAAQIRLAVRFVKHAVAAQLIGPDRPLFILGAGAAGVAAAVAAVRRDVPVTVRETEAQPFSRQAACSTRWLHPNQYDWPQHWFSTPTFPRAGDEEEEDLAPLAWTADFSHRIAAQWRAQYHAFRKNVRNIYEVFGAPQLKHEGGHYEELVDECQRNLPKGAGPKFAAFLLCRGFAPEDVSIGTYSGFRFWDTDPFERPRADMQVSGSADVIIAGFGDGGMQDFIRFVFGAARPGEIIEVVDEALDGELSTTAKWRRFRAAVISSLKDGQCPRAPFAAAELCQGFVASLDRSIVRMLYERLQGLIAFNFDRDRITLVCERELFPPSFPLNRLIVRLVERFGRDGLLRNAPQIICSRVSDVTGRDHRCENDAHNCHGVAHDCRLATPRMFHSLVVTRGLEHDDRPLEQSVA